MGIDLHKDEFDDSTNAKLFIFESFLKKWLGVFTASKKIYFHKVNIFDYFAGPGTDTKGNIGSPIIAANTIPGYESFILKNKVHVNLFLNEYALPKYNKLVANISDIPVRDYLSVDIQNKDFGQIFKEHYGLMKDSDAANFIFLDQNGVKHITFEVFDKLIGLPVTDFMFFISTNHLKRFLNQPSIKKYLEIKNDFFDGIPQYHIHRKVSELFKQKIPAGKEYYLSSFTLKKANGNIYGLIFGTNNPKGLERFVESAWEIDKVRGEANFDIDEENIIEGQLDLFSGEADKPKKVEKFEKELRKNLLSKAITTDKGLYIFSLQEGFLPNKHGKKVLKELVKDGKVKDKGYQYTYNAYRNPLTIELV